MTKIKKNPVLPYIVLPVIVTALLLTRVGNTDAFILLRYELLVVAGYIAAVLDLKTRRIPNKLLSALLVLLMLIMALKVLFDTDIAINMLLDCVLGCAAGGGLFLLVFLISRKGLGGGDVKFMAAAGAYLGFGGILPAILLGSVLAALTGGALILLKKIGRKDVIPLVPFLYIGILITVFTQY